MSDDQKQVDTVENLQKFTDSMEKLRIKTDREVEQQQYEEERQYLMSIYKQEAEEELAR